MVDKYLVTVWLPGGRVIAKMCFANSHAHAHSMALDRWPLASKIRVEVQ